MTGHLTYEYKRVGNCSLKADVYPVRKPHAPVILFLHGGALIWGSRAMIIPDQIELYNQAGYTVISLDYRLAPETKLPEIIADLQDAIYWVRMQADRLGIDSERLAVVGSSAGGYLSLITGTFPEKPRAIVSFYGYGDILAEWYIKPSEFFLAKERITQDLAYSVIRSEPISAGDRDRFLFYLFCRQRGIWPAEVSGYDTLFERAKILPYCPVYNIGSDYPPTLLFHGDQDRDVPYEQSVQMYRELTNRGLIAQLVTLSGEGHIFDYDMSKSQVRDAFKTVLDFLKRFV